MYRIPRGDISLARRFIDKKQEGVYPAMAKESVWTKLRRKVDKEFADELQRQQDIEQQAREQAKALEKQQKKEAAIAAYREKRDLTVADFFRIADLPLPDDFADIADHTISDFTADPRRLTPDSIFLYWGKSPISAGDPASVLQMAIDSGCLCVISNKPCAHPHTLLLPDTTDALEGTNRIREAYIKASAYIRSLHKAKVITVTGSVGKTSTKEMIEAVLRQHYKNPLISKGNNNSMFSITRNIQSLKRTTNVYLQEVGAFAPKTIEYSARQLAADIAVYTNIGVSHIESYGSQEALTADKLSLSTFGKPDGLAIINYDDPILMGHSFTQQVITYSLKNPQATYYAKDILRADDGYTFTLVDRAAAEEHPAQIHVLGEHNILNAVVAFAVGRALQLPDAEILAGIASYQPSGMRQNLLQAGKYRILADCYNSSLLAVDNTLKVLDELRLPDKTKRIVVLGDVLALGDLSEETHREIGRVCTQHKMDLLIGYGIAIRYAIEEAAAAGMQAHYYADRAEMEEAVRAAVRPGDIVLFKASHGVNLGASMDKLFGTDLNESSAIGHKQFRIEVHGDFEFYIFENSASLKTYLGHDAVVEVPAFVTATVTDELHETEVTRDLPVEKIGKTAFRGNEEIREVVLPETVVRIRDGAFQGSGLESLDAPDSLLSIGARAFADCPNLTTVNLSEATDQLGDAVTENSPQAMIMYR